MDSIRCRMTRLVTTWLYKTNARTSNPYEGLLVRAFRWIESYRYALILARYWP